MTARICDKCGNEFDTGECGTNHDCSEDEIITNEDNLK